MKAIILAAGRGSRLKELTVDQPKCLSRVGGKPLLDWQISGLRAGGVREVTIVTGYKADLLCRQDVRTIYNKEWQTTQMVWSLLCAKSEFNEDVIVSYSDLLYGGSFVSALMAESSKNVAVLYDTQWRKLWEDRFANPLEDAETFRINGDGLIVNIGQRAANIEEIQGQFIGLMRISPMAMARIIDYAEENVDKIREMEMTKLLNGLIISGYPVYGIPIRGGWCEIDKAEDIALAERLLASSKIKLS